MSEVTPEDGALAAIRVFIAEDEPIIRLDLSETLASLGFEVVGETSRGDEAEELIRELRPDVAILDIKMPGRSGIEVAESLSEDLVCAVVVLSAFSQHSLVRKAADAGVLAYLLKPFQPSELSVSIELALARHRQLSELSGEVTDLEQRLEDRKALDRAKGVLIDQQGMSEADAWRHIQKRAMDERLPIRAVADSILQA